MTLLSENIKKILNKPQSLKIIYPPGFSTTALNEIRFILENLWAAKPFKGEVLLLKTEIRIQRIYFFAIMELLLRSKCLSDLRLIIYSGKVIGKKAFEKACHTISWLTYVQKHMSIKIKVNSVASHAFHEGALKDILSEIIQPHVAEIVCHDEKQATTCVYAELYKDKLTISISLAGNPLYKRGYRETLSASAPLREDFASCCIQKALQFAHTMNPSFLPRNILIPFSGTGTFAFEYMLNASDLPPLWFDRDYAIQEMPFFKKEYVHHIIKQANGHCSTLNDIHIDCLDNSDHANKIFATNIERFNRQLLKYKFPVVPINSSNKNFLETNFDANIGNTFILLNPPYGIRLPTKKNNVDFYKNIASKINEISSIHQLQNTHVLGFILCPTLETWSMFSRQIGNAALDTYHFTQGGLDIRVCQFYI